MNQSARLGLPLLAARQAQKEISHNEALALVDIAVAASVEATGSLAPPGNPIVGECHALGANPTGEWEGHAHALAGYTEGGWRFIAPVEGMRVYDKADGTIATFDGAQWMSAPAAIADAVGGDEVAKINAILAALRDQGIIAS